MTKLKTYLYLWGPVAIWASIIFILSSFSSLPSAEKIWWDYIFKKSAHMFMFAIFYFLLVRAGQKRNFKIYALSFLISVSYAISDEIHQSFTPGRHPSLMDVGFDTLGMIISHLKIRNLI